MDIFWGVLSAIIITVVVSTFHFAGLLSGIERVQRQAVQRGYALHCPIDGRFAWRGECDTNE